MSQTAPLLANRRLGSLDALRGLTIAAMLLVNNPGSWTHIYPPLEHAAWNGWTLTDLVFPFFLFMVGVSMMFSFPKRLAWGSSRSDLMTHVVRRAAALMILGWWGSVWANILWPGDAVIGVLGILMRVGFVAAVLGSVVLLAGTERSQIWWMIFGTGAALFLISAWSMSFNDPLLEGIAGIRIPGVLVRIGWCYALASAIWFATPTVNAVWWWIAGMLGGYAVFMMLVPVPGFGLPDLSRGFPTAETPAGELFSNWAFWIDYHVLGSHTWSVRQLYDATGKLIWSFDPEGIVSTIPATATILFGVITGHWIRDRDTTDGQKLNRLFVAACWITVAGLVLSIWMPINKRLWTSSYTVFTAGMGMLTLAVLYHAIDMKGRAAWFYPALAYGRNAIFIFVVSGMMATALARLTINETSLKTLIYENLPGSPVFASFLFGIGFVAFWTLVAWILDRMRIYFKI